MPQSPKMNFHLQSGHTAQGKGSDEGLAASGAAGSPSLGSFRQRLEERDGWVYFPRGELDNHRVLFSLKIL